MLRAGHGPVAHLRCTAQLGSGLARGCDAQAALAALLALPASPHLRLLCLATLLALPVARLLCLPLIRICGAPSCSCGCLAAALAIALPFIPPASRRCALLGLLRACRGACGLARRARSCRRLDPKYTQKLLGRFGFPFFPRSAWSFLPPGPSPHSGPNPLKRRRLALPAIFVRFLAAAARPSFFHLFFGGFWAPGPGGLFEANPLICRCLASPAFFFRLPLPLAFFLFFVAGLGRWCWQS